VTAIAAHVWAEGLGIFISRGINLSDTCQLITGSIAASL
jgi:ABC-type proline/glycine betaine transport system permease subunit